MGEKEDPNDRFHINDRFTYVNGKVCIDLKRCAECGGDAQLSMSGHTVDLCMVCATKLWIAVKNYGPHPEITPTSSGNNNRGHSSSSKVQLKVYRRDNFACLYCGESNNLSVDHIDPNGGDEMTNLATACRSCNSSKSDRTPEEADMEFVGGEDPRGTG